MHDAQRRVPGRGTITRRAEPSLQRHKQSVAVAHAHRRVVVREQCCVATRLVTRAEDNRSAERRGLEHRMEPPRMKATADVRRGGERVEVSQHTNAVHEDHIRGLLRGSSETCERHALVERPSLDRRQVFQRRLVRCDDESRTWHASANPRPRGKQYRLVGGPRRAGHECRPIAGQRVQER